SPEKAIQRPSGEYLGKSSVPGFDVRRRAVPPERATLHRSPAYVNTMLLPLMSGNRSSRVLAGPAWPRAGEVMQMATRMTEQKAKLQVSVLCRPYSFSLYGTSDFEILGITSPLL